MRSTLTCTACSTVLGIPKTGMPKDGLPCNWCGYVNQLAPEPEASTKARQPDLEAEAPARQEHQPDTKAQSPSAPARAKENPEPGHPIHNEAVEPKPAPHRWADDEDDNGQPYLLPHEEAKTRLCSKCKKQIDLLAVVCVHCGFDESAGKKVERTFQAIDFEWESGWKKSTRLAIFLGFQALNFMSLVVGLASGGSLPASIFSIAFYIALQAFLLGTYDTGRIRRNKKGQTEITITWRVAFIPQPVKKVNWKENEGVAFGHYDATSVFDWLMAVFLLPFCLVPAILWWWYVIKPDRYFAALTRDHEYPETYLFRGMSELRAKEVVQIATDATGLPLVTPI